MSQATEHNVSGFKSQFALLITMYVCVSVSIIVHEHECTCSKRVRVCVRMFAHTHASDVVYFCL